MIVIDGSNGVLGRIASFAAKKALQGEEIKIVHAEKIVLSGNRNKINARYAQRRNRGAVRFPSNPEQIVKRTIRGMMKYQKGRGADAFAKIRCYSGEPEEFKKEKKISFESKNKNMYTIKELGNLLKWNKE